MGRTDGNVLEYNFLGKELSDDLSAIWIYLEVTRVVNPAVVTVEFEVLFELYSDQKNILSFQVDRGKERIFLLDIGKPKIEISIQ